MTGMLTNDEGDLKIERGSIAIGDCTADVAERVLRAYPGEFKEQPTLGMFAAGQTNGNGSPFWCGEARKQLKTQGIKAAVSIEAGEIVVKIIDEE